MKKGLSYTLEDDKIRAYMLISTEEKLKWLEEINELTEQVLTPLEKRARAKLIAGEI